MDVALLGDLIALAKFQNFSTAARSLNMTQPALSKRIASLERSLGFKLVEREPEIRLTDEGAIMLRFAQQVLPAYRRALSDCQASLKKPDKLRLGWFSSSSYDRMLSMCDDIPCEHLGYDSRMSPLTLLSSGKADIVLYYDLGRYPATRALMEAEGVVCTPVGADARSLAVAKNHSLAAKESIGLEDIKKYPFMISNGGIYDIFCAVVAGYFGCSEEDFTFVLNPVGAELRNFSQIDPGDALFVVESSEIRNVLERRGDIVFFDTVDGHPIEMPLGLLYCPDNRNPNVRRFVEALAAV